MTFSVCFTQEISLLDCYSTVLTKCNFHHSPATDNNLEQIYTMQQRTYTTEQCMLASFIARNRLPMQEADSTAQFINKSCFAMLPLHSTPTSLDHLIADLTCVLHSCAVARGNQPHPCGYVHRRYKLYKYLWHLRPTAPFTDTNAAICLSRATVGS